MVERDSERGETRNRGRGNSADRFACNEGCFTDECPIGSSRRNSRKIYFAIELNTQTKHAMMHATAICSIAARQSPHATTRSSGINRLAKMTNDPRNI